MPRYVVINDAQAAKIEYIEVVSVMYAGATLSSRECLEQPAPETPIEDAPRDSRLEQDERSQHDRDSRRGGLFSNFKSRISKIFRAPEEDDSDLMDE